MRRRTEEQWNEFKRVCLENKIKKFFTEYGTNILLNESGEIAPCVYFVQGENGGPIKIGYSADIADRMVQLQRESISRLNVLLLIPGSFNKETSLHKQFAEYQLQGEWFEPVPELLEEIEYLKELSNKRAAKNNLMRVGYKLVIVDRIFRDTIIRIYSKVK